MKKITFIEYKNTRILYQDFSNINCQNDLDILISESKEIVSKEHPVSLKMITDLTNIHLNVLEVTTQVRNYLIHNKPYVKAGALFGLGSIYITAINYVMKIAQRNNMKCFNTKEDGLDWLVKY
ncbi:MAG: hypothetical protein HQK49_19755 [Oligoflexia bacterium]|nr:hypothetical protein [Oligoflexia bacterium]